MNQGRQESLSNALILLRKVLDGGETRFTKEDWQMLQVARFLVSKERFIKRDADNITLYYAGGPSFYYLDDLSNEMYALAKYIYDSDPGLIIDSTKTVSYGIPMNPKFSKLTNPNFDEAVIIINMLRNSIAHGNAVIDFENSVLKIDNTMPLETDPNIIKFHICTELPISMLSKVDIAKIIKKNQTKLKKMFYKAIAHKSFTIQDDKVIVMLDNDGFEVRVGFTTKEFMDLYYMYDKEFKNEYLINEIVDEYDVNKTPKLTLKRETLGERFIVKPGTINTVRAQKRIKDLSALTELISNTPNKVLDADVVSRFLELAECTDIPLEDRIDALYLFKQTIDSVNFQNDTERSISSISYALGITSEERSLDFIALYNYMAILFAHYPLKEGNAMLTEFLDLSTLSIDQSNTRDIDISNFYHDVEKIIKRHLNKVNSNRDQYTHPIPCLTEYLRCLTDILKKFKTRNNAYIRHIRNSLEHSDIQLDGAMVELRDYIHKGDEVDKTFRSKINLNKLIRLSAAYTFIYDIPTYKDYQTFVQNDPNDFLSFTFVDMFRELTKGIDIDLLKEFCIMLNDLSMNGLQKEFNLDSNVVDVIEELPYAITQAKNNRGRGTK